MTAKELEQYDALLSEARARKARRDIWHYCQYMDDVFFTDKKKHCRDLAYMIQGLLYRQAGDNNRLFAALPPRSGKSYTLSMACTFAFGNFPDGAIMRNCYGGSLAFTISYDVRQIIRSEKYRRLFPHVELAEDSTAVQSWRIRSHKSRPSYFGAGIGGDVTGKGCDLLAIMDDPHKNIDDGKSPLMQRRAERFYYSVHQARLETGCPEIIAATRWDKNDLPGRVISKSPESWNQLIIPALNENGETFCEEIKTTEEYKTIQKEADVVIWKAEFMQNPVAAEGILMEESELRYFRKEELCGEPDSVLMAVDTADEGKNFLAAVFIAVYGERYFIIDVIYTQEKIELTWALVAQKIIETKAQAGMFESNFGGKAYAIKIKELLDVENYYCNILWKPSTRNKETRIIMGSGFIKERFFFLDVDQYEVGSPYWKFMEHLTSYNRIGGNEYDDANDCVTIAADFIKSALGKGGIHGAA